ncbi:MAG TPA: hypothetical protein DCX34_01995 [Roseovarius sp.]|nr:hypothetical protein [Roseovarius sp.]
MWSRSWMCASSRSARASIPQEPNQRWSLDFISDALEDGRSKRRVGSPAHQSDLPRHGGQDCLPYLLLQKTCRPRLSNVGRRFRGGGLPPPHPHPIAAAFTSSSMKGTYWAKLSANICTSLAAWRS